MEGCLRARGSLGEEEVDRKTLILALIGATASVVAGIIISGCDSSISGSALENQPPNTVISVRDTSLVDNLEEEDRLTSTIFASWSGTDPDGFVASFELRFHDTVMRPGPEEGWIRTTANDSLILLPIPRGERAANVVFEVRAIDNEGLVDPDPARTVFPIQNSPPTIRLSQFDAPPDTTFTVVSFAWTADDPEGIENLDRIEVSLNDSTSFAALPPDVEFVTLIADNTDGLVADARVFTGRGLQSTEIRVPGLRLDDRNTFYVRSVDATDTTSTREEYTWFVKAPRSEVLYVNDYRKNTPRVREYHAGLLEEHLPAGMPIDYWDISKPDLSDVVGNLPRSNQLPPNAESIRETLRLFKYIYWVSSNTVNAVGGNNLPLVASVTDLFFEEGGKMMVHSPITQPQDPEANLANPAILLLPLSDLLFRPDSLQRLELGIGAEIDPVSELPGLSEALPRLKSQTFLINELPYFAEGANTVPLYDAKYSYLTRRGDRGAWPGPNTVASISADSRVGLFGLPLINDQSGEPLIVGLDGDPGAAREAVKLILRSLDFPGR